VSVGGLFSWSRARIPISGLVGLLADFATICNELFPADVQEDALEVRIRAEGLASLVGELRHQDERMAT
jgi:hypothetical protein